MDLHAPRQIKDIGGKNNMRIGLHGPLREGLSQAQPMESRSLNNMRAVRMIASRHHTEPTTVFWSSFEKKCWDFHRKYPHLMGLICYIAFASLPPLYFCCAKEAAVHQLYRALSRRNFFPSKNNIIHTHTYISMQQRSLWVHAILPYSPPGQPI